MPKPESGLPVLNPTKPGRPWAPPQPDGGGTDPTVPTAPAPETPPELPTDPTSPTDPTIPVELTTDQPVLELPPEGMLRISKSGESDRFVWPVHAAGWAGDGWEVHAPVSIDDGSGGDPGPDDDSAPSEGADETGRMLEDALEPAAVLPSDPVALVEPVVPVAPLRPDATATDFSAMTKAEIREICVVEFGVTLDASMTKAEMVAEATRLEAEAVAAAAAPAGDEALPTVPMDLI
ncbi:hypothetical protein KBZ18_11090 [Synechococcus sp. Cruz-9H2]|uniref:hypothetical protein n=1 Tax=unclassified Synechococcus TaxID=2626047 RepID=UPI0020CCCC89|nr:MULTISPECIES: hypothetical protein [unclassified Synechococcus]MCP9820034.1 hypothetical protein [Synechococcus sp. Cruz-9H2]MCP9844340.1 hypothetical protein [Synechococcus sp. Edmonson 11F2]MCP9856464.1 hypothetical protein [Synechococcus sp. Cruz-9C9]MCP9863761.1 hypothetical protein [Synechococcus sp. Cruz-7E5]MCP9870944.1 hypothetical protein [Synechococcus sp. Cruz-7B9]